MDGVGVILVTVSGAAWRMTAPGAPPCLGLGSTVDLGRCSRRPCGRGGSTPHGLLYPEFQHRPPPPSYQASMQEYRLRLLLLDRDRQSGRMRSTASPPPTYRSNVGSLLRIPLSSRYNNGSSNSIFGGISGIISGAVGGSSNSVNNVVGPPVPSGGHADLLQVSSSPNPYGSDGHSTLPPSYRSVHPQPSPTNGPAAQPPRQPPALPSQPGEGGEDAKNLISDANTHSTESTGPNRTTAGVNHHHAPSIIKIDDRCATTAMPKRNSIPNVVSLIDTAGGVSQEEVLSAAKGAGTEGNVNSRLCPTGTVPTANSSGALAGSAGGKDLVTIVTISGTIEPSGASRSVYTSGTSNSSNSSSCNSNNQLTGGGGGGGGGGATCTLLNSNSKPLLATVIPVSKSTTTTTSPSAATVAGSEPL
uniref:Uncharacterized protein n=1 Tax=Anopheles christyi TaxID=43041 RepID=A0A182K7U3_9DIPT